MKQFIDSLGKIFRRGYGLIFAFVFIMYIGAAALPAFLMSTDHQKAAVFIYRGFHYFCHQYPWRSFFLTGQQLYYPLFPDPGKPDLLSIEQASGIPIESIEPRHFYGTPEMGYKMAVCQRDCAIYAFMALFCILFFISGNRFRQLLLPGWILLGLVPIGIDGISQLISQMFPSVLPFRESTPLLRSITGALFGLSTCWFLLPQLEMTLQKGETP